MDIWNIVSGPKGSPHRQHKPHPYNTNFVRQVDVTLQVLFLIFLSKKYWTLSPFSQLFNLFVGPELLHWNLLNYDPFCDVNFYKGSVFLNSILVKLEANLSEMDEWCSGRKTNILVLPSFSKTILFKTYIKALLNRGILV